MNFAALWEIPFEMCSIKYDVLQNSRGATLSRIRNLRAAEKYATKTYSFIIAQSL